MKKRIILVTVAVLLAVIGTFAVYSYGKGADKRALDKTTSAKALVVSKRVPAGTSWADTVKGNYLTQETFPADNVPSTALSDTKDSPVASDAVALADLVPGTIVLSDAFGTKTPQTGALDIPKGLLAISVTLPANAEVGGYIGPDSEVAIFATAKYGTGSGSSDLSKGQIFGDQSTLTKTVVDRASVLAVSQAPVDSVDGSGDSSGSSGSSAPLVTLALSQRDVERVVLSQTVGDLYLALVSPSSTVNVNDPGVDNAIQVTPVKLFLK
jgi:pilus assembly protein CpaB